MYWIYFIIFILAVLAPDIVPRDRIIFFLKEEQLEELLIFILGLTGFIIFRWKDRQLVSNLNEKIEIQKESRQISRNLTDTYSYIGETNRKLDIMKNISINLLNAPSINPKREKEFFNIILESIFILAKSKKFIIRFINTEDNKTKQEIKSRRRIFLRVRNEYITNLFNENKIFTESDHHFIIISPKEINKMIASVIISKNNKHQKLEDPDIIKALASQSLFLYVFGRNNSESKNLIN